MVKEAAQRSWDEAIEMSNGRLPWHTTRTNAFS